MEIYKKLAKVKSEIGKISKDSTNPFFKSKYFDVNALLEHVEPLLAKNDLVLLQPIINGNVITEIIDAESGEKVSSELMLENFSDPQKMGSAITYYRRYTLQSLLGLQAEDDDANKASKPTSKTESKATASELPWLNRMNGKEVSRDWNRALATIRTGKDLPYIKTKFKISKENEQLLQVEAKKEMV